MTSEERDQPTDLLATAARVGQLAWVERRVFAVEGRWASTLEEPSIAVHFGEHSRRHGWHAQLWFDRLPEVASIDAESLVRSPGPATDALFAAVDELDDGIAALVATTRVLLPVIIHAVDTLAAAASTVAEPSLVRWSRFVRTDDVEELLGGDRLLRRAIPDDDAMASAIDVQAALERRSIATGGLLA